MTRGAHTDPERARLERACADAARALGLGPGEPLGTGGLSVALQRWLVGAVEEACGPLPALRSRLQAAEAEERAAARHEVAAALHRAGGDLDERLVERLAADPRVAAPAGRLERARAQAGAGGWELWRSRLAQLAFERALGEAVAPELQVELAPLPPGELEQALEGEFTHGVVCGELLGFAGELFPLVLDARCQALEDGRTPGVDVLGVHHEWLTDRGDARRAIFFDHRHDALVEAPFLPALPLHGVQFLYLGAEGEQERHERLSARLTGCVQANPYPAARTADSKWETYRLLRAAGVPTPATVRIPAGASPEAIAAELSALPAEALASGIVVQPDLGTEGCGVAAFPAATGRPASGPALEHIRRLQRSGDVVVRSCIPGRRWQSEGLSYSADLRVNVAWDGERYRAESGYLQVAGDAAAFASSVGRGGRIVKLSEGALSGMELTAAEQEVALETACAAARALSAGSGPGHRLALVGLDLKLEGEPKRARAWVLDANPRPAGLSHAELFETGEPGVAAGLWKGLLASAGSHPEGRAT
jgi:hypothetical protein